MKKSVSRSFLKVLSVTAAAAAILTLTGCVEEPASTSPASSAASSSTSTSSSTSSSASSKTEQEATSTSQNPELPASSSSEASSPASSSTPASSEVKTQPGDTAKEPEKLGGCVEAEGVSFHYLGIPEQVEASDGSSIIMAAFFVENKTGKPLNMGQNSSVLEEILYADEEENTIDAESVFNSSSAACFTVGNNSQRAACYVGTNPGEETLKPGDAAMVYLCISEPSSWSSMIVKITIGNTSRYFRLMPSEIGKIINY